MGIRLAHIILLLVIFQGTVSLRPSPGCSSSSQLKPSFRKVTRKTVYMTHNDKLLGPVDRNYIIQTPKWIDNTPRMLVLDLHGWGGSASWQIRGSGWGRLAGRKDFIVVWPDGMRDGPNEWGSWNCSMTDGPKGPTCNLDRNSIGQSQECYYSCPLCDEDTSCDWTSCYDDIGFMDAVIQDVAEEYCIDLDHVHLSGISNGGMFAYFVASMATDALGLASINPVVGSSLVGYGTPPDVEINFSIVDLHATDDDVIPHDVSSDYSYGTGPHDSVISWDGYYYDQKKNLLASWAEQMECGEEQDYNGHSSLRCVERSCKNGKAILSCLGEFGHDYPPRGVGEEIAYEFMKNHPRN